MSEEYNTNTDLHAKYFGKDSEELPKTAMLRRFKRDLPKHLEKHINFAALDECTNLNEFIKMLKTVGKEIHSRNRNRFQQDDEKEDIERLRKQLGRPQVYTSLPKDKFGQQPSQQQPTTNNNNNIHNLTTTTTLQGRFVNNNDDREDIFRPKTMFFK